MLNQEPMLDDCCKSLSTQDIMILWKKFVLIEL